jgi:hypothetical protein
MAGYKVLDITGGYQEEVTSLRDAVEVVMSGLELEYSNLWGDGEGLLPALPEGYEALSYEISVKGWKRIYNLISQNKGITRNWQYADGTLSEVGNAWVIERI